MNLNLSNCLKIDLSSPPACVEGLASCIHYIDNLQLYGIKYYYLSKFIWPIDRILTVTTTLDRSGPGSNGNESVYYIHQISWIGASLSDAV